MKHSAKTILRIVLTLAVILISSHTIAQEQPNDNLAPETKRNVSKSAPDLADLIPLATKLTENLATLENSVTGVLDISGFEEKFNRIEEDLKDPVAQLQQIKDSKDVKVSKLVEIREAIELENELLKEISRPVRDTIRQFGVWRNDWHEKKQQWNEWQLALLENGDLDQLNSIFVEAKDTINKALGIVNSQLGSMLTDSPQENRQIAKIRTFKKELYNFKFFSLDDYYDISIYPSFHNQWAVPLYIVLTRSAEKS